jgi:plasmid maintenance system antidote protein VapI
LDHSDNAIIAVTTETHMALPAPTMLMTAPKTSPERGWAREMLARAGVTQRELARAWGVPDSSASRWLDGGYNAVLTLGNAVTFCRLTGMSLNELALRLGHKPLKGGRVELAPVADPPLPTIRIAPSPTTRGKWLLLAHIEVEAGVLADLTSALDEAAANRRVARRIGLRTAKVAPGS